MRKHLKGINILLGITGGISAYKTAELARLFIKDGAELKVVMTGGAMEFITPLTFQAISGNPVITDLYSDISGIEHIEYTDWADIFVIAPATANIIGKMASGIGDDALSTMTLAFDGVFLIAPAMNSKMYLNRIVQENINRLKDHSYQFIGPESGNLACREEGIGRMSEPETIFEKAVSLLSNRELEGKSFLVTAGPTREDLDPVRFISNRSSGKMGYAIAVEAKRRGAEVTLISGPTSLEAPEGVNFIRISSTEEMHKAVMENAGEQDAIVMAAAVADYIPAERSEQKIKKSDALITLTLKKSVDIIMELGKKKRDFLLVGFAAETENVTANAKKKIKDKGLDLIVANDVLEDGAGFDVDTNRVYIFDTKGLIKETEIMPKEDVAAIIIDTIKDKLT